VLDSLVELLAELRGLLRRCGLFLDDLGVGADVGVILIALCLLRVHGARVVADPLRYADEHLHHELQRGVDRFD
jgi:hypothetical protein